MARLNPGASAETEYRPGVMLGKVKFPLSLVWAVRTLLVAVSVGRHFGVCNYRSGRIGNGAENCRVDGLAINGRSTTQPERTQGAEQA